jgi:hypothetical protein
MATQSNLINCFRPGQHRAMDGRVHDFPAERVARAVEIYDPAKHRAPIIIGHGGLEAPAYGHVSAFSLSADGMEAKPEGMDAEFAALVNREAYPNVSLGWFGPDHPRNPCPGEWYPAEVSFLGAVPPAVRNLRKPKFAAFAGFAASDTAAIVRFGGEWDDVTNASLWRRFREWLIGKFGQDEADKVVPSWDVQSLEQSAQDELREAQTPSDTPMPAFAGANPEKSHVKTPAEIEAENADLKRRLAQAEARERTAAETRRREELTAFAARLATDAGGQVRLTPARQRAVVDVLMRVGQPGADGGLVQFAGDDGSSRPLVDVAQDLLRELVEGAPVQTTLTEFAGTHRADKTPVKNPLVADAERRAAAAKQR